VTPLRIALLLAFGLVAWRGYERFADNPAVLPDPTDASRANREYFVGFAMGSPVTITIDADDPAKAKIAARAALEELERLDQMLSDWKETSDLTKFNRSSELTQEVPESFARCLERALHVSSQTDGLFDPTVAPLVQLWRDARKTQALPDAAALASARAKTPGRVPGPAVRKSIISAMGPSWVAARLSNASATKSGLRREVETILMVGTKGKLVMEPLPVVK
jgi:hypothetical protein